MHAYATGTSLPAYGPFVLRLALGAVFIAHGAQKLFGLWGGAGLDGTSLAFAQLGIHPSYALAVIWGGVEFGGGLMLLFGALTVASSLALLLTLLVSMWKVHFVHGFFLNWNLVPGQGHGNEFNIALLGALVSLILTGPGALSIDRHRAESAAAVAAGRARLRSGAV